LEELYTLGALDDGQKLTDIGRKMASFPLEPKFSKALIHGQRLRCTKEVIGVIACLSVESIFFCPHDKRDEAGEAKKKFLNSEGDHLTYLAVLNSYETNAASDKSWCQKNFVLSRAMQQVVNIKNQLERFCVEKSAKDDDNQLADSETQHERVLQALIAGFFMNVALRQPDGTYKTLFTNQTVYIHPSSVLFGKKPDAVMYTDITWTSKCYMRCVSRIDLQWLLRVCPPKMFANVQMLNR
jgi:HrpA-like RNA helicase